MEIDELLDMIDKEEKALEEFITQANSEIAFRRGRIALLKDLIQNYADRQEGVDAS